METEWWHSRRVDLLALADRTSPLYVFNEEILNEILFDLLSIQVVDRLLYPVHANPHSNILRKGVELGVGFRCISCHEVDGLLRGFPRLDPGWIVFLAGSGTVEDVVQAFDRGVQVAADRTALQQRPDLFENRWVFIRGDHETDYGEMGRTGALVKGFYHPLQADVAPVSGRDEPEAFLPGALAHFPEEATLILGNGTEQGMHGETERMDIPAFGEYLEAVAHASPQFRLWLELPCRMLALAGILMTRVVEVGGHMGTRSVRLNAKIEGPVWNTKGGISHRILNFSRPDSDQTVKTTRIIGPAGRPGDGMDVPEAPEVIEEGDILIFTHMGATGAEVNPADDCWNGVPQHYLHARSLCAVDIHEKQRKNQMEKQGNPAGRRCHE